MLMIVFAIKSFWFVFMRELRGMGMFLLFIFISILIFFKFGCMFSMELVLML